MKILLPVAALLVGLCLGGCHGDGDLGEDVRSALGPREQPKERTFAADQRPVWTAARKAVDDLDYHFEKGGPAEGTLEALSKVERGEDEGSGRQVRIKVSMQPAPDSGTVVQVSFTEILEQRSSDQPGFATETPLLDTPLYNVFFNAIQSHLQSPGPRSAQGTP